MSDNWVVQNLENALNTWNEKLAEIWQIITQSPEPVSYTHLDVYKRQKSKRAARNRKQKLPRLSIRKNLPIRQSSL